MKLFNSSLSGKALFNASLLTLLFMLTSFTSMAADEKGIYQSSFDDYKPLTNDSLADWKTIHDQPPGGGHADHSMHHGMHHGDKAMDHSKMNHSEMNHGEANHNEKNHSEAHSMPNNTNPKESSQGEPHAH